MDLDLTTRSLVIRAPAMRLAPGGLAPSADSGAETSASAILRQDAILARLSALRSSELVTVHGALHNCDVSDPLIATQVCLLLAVR